MIRNILIVNSKKFKRRKILDRCTKGKDNFVTITFESSFMIYNL